MIKKILTFHQLMSLLCIVVVIIVYAYQVNNYWHYTNDDAYITFRYSRNLASGYGPYYNLGEHVEGYTNFLLMLLMSVVALLFDPAYIPFVAKLLGSLLGGGAILLTYILFRQLFSLKKYQFSYQMANTGAIMSSGIVAVTPAFALNSVSGLETMMFSFCFVLALILGKIEEKKERLMGSAIAFSVLILTRPEGCLLFAVYWLAHFIALVFRSMKENTDNNVYKSIYRSKVFRLLLYNVLIVLGVFLCHLALRFYLYDGELLPNTYYAKKGGSWSEEPWSYLYNGLLTPVFGLIGLCLSLLGYCLNHRRYSLSVFSLTVLAVFASCLPFILGTDWMLGWRFVIPYLPLVAVLTVGGWLNLLVKLSNIKAKMVFVIFAACLILLWVMSDKVRKFLYEYIHLQARGYQTGHMALGNWLKGESKKGDTIVLMDIGIVGFICRDQRILDMTGLTDRFIAKSEGTFLRKQFDVNYILDQKPEFIVLVFFAPGKSYHLPPQNLRFHYWSPMASNLAKSEQFRRWYVNIQPGRKSATDWLDSFAIQIGAVKVFEHAYPGYYYLLAVFHRSIEQKATPLEHSFRYAPFSTGRPSTGTLKYSNNFQKSLGEKKPGGKAWGQLC